MDEESWWRAMAADPLNLVLPLVVADWYEESGKPLHAQCLRLLFERARVLPVGPVAAEWSRRMHPKGVFVMYGIGLTAVWESLLPVATRIRFDWRPEVEKRRVIVDHWATAVQSHRDWVVREYEADIVWKATRNPDGSRKEAADVGS